MGSNSGLIGWTIHESVIEGVNISTNCGKLLFKITGKDGGVRETDYAYDALNRVASVSRVGVGTLANYSYDAVGNVSNVTRANGVTSSYGYDDLHRLTAIQHKKGAEVLSQFQYALSADGKRNTLQEFVKYPASQTVASVNRTVFYGYDNAGRLDAEQRQSTSTLAAGGTQEKTARTLWTYDKVGNRLTQAVSNYDGIGITSPSVLKSTFNTSYNYNINDWLTKTTSVRHDDSGESTFVSNFEYNANGSQSAVTRNVGTPDEKRVPYFYDFEQKLTRIGETSDTVRHLYAYDADSNRIAESNTNVSGTDARNYLVDSNNSNAQIVEEYDNASTLLAHYDWNDAELLREASWNTNTNAYDIREPLADGHNSTRQLLDDSGAISDVYAFDAWGNSQVNIGGSSNPYRYNAQRLDASGLYYLRARQYSSGIGRFLTHDPVLGDMNNPIAQHRYLYAGDDAVNAVDPGGKSFLTANLTAMQISTIIAATIVVPYSMYAGVESANQDRAAHEAANHQFPEISYQLRDVLHRVDREFRHLTSSERDDLAYWLYRIVDSDSNIGGIQFPANGSWDIRNLTNTLGEGGDAWVDTASQPNLSGNPQYRFVRVENQTFHTYAVNYVLFGRLSFLLNESGDGYNYSTAYLYTIGAKALHGGAELTATVGWMRAGWNGWHEGRWPTPVSEIYSLGSSNAKVPRFTIGNYYGEGNTLINNVNQE